MRSPKLLPRGSSLRGTLEVTENEQEMELNRE